MSKLHTEDELFGGEVRSLLLVLLPGGADLGVSFRVKNTFWFDIRFFIFVVLSNTSFCVEGLVTFIPLLGFIVSM